MDGSVGMHVHRSHDMTGRAVRIIRPVSHALIRDELAELWRRRDLLFVFVQREIAVRYRQAVIGVLWVVLQPLITSLILTLVFSVFARVSSGDVPYPVFALSGLVIWQFFNRSVIEGGQSLVTNVALISKVSFPRLIVPLTAPAAAALDCLIVCALLLALTAAFGVELRWTVVFLPVVILMTGMLAVGCVLWLAPLNAMYRDVAVVLPFVLQVMMYLSPVAYPASLIPEKVRWIYELNPIAVMVEATRWLVVGGTPPGMAGLCVFASLVALLCLGGLKFFRRLESNLVDVI
jgi:lipopolysaccharide transport system permease protein